MERLYVGMEPGGAKCAVAAGRGDGAPIHRCAEHIRIKRDLILRRAFGSPDRRGGKGL